MKIHCTACGEKSSTRGFSRGSFILEVFLWLCFLVPGLFYTLWRITGVIYQCPVCSSRIVKKVEGEFSDGLPSLTTIALLGFLGSMIVIFIF